MLLIVITYQRSISKGTVTIREMQHMSKVLQNAVLFNLVYKDFLKHPTAFENQDQNKLLNSRVEANVYLNVMFNNIFMKTPFSSELFDRPDNEIDIYNGYFNRDNSYYEELTSIKLTIKKSIPKKLFSERKSILPAAVPMPPVPTNLPPELTNPNPRIYNERDLYLNFTDKATLFYFDPFDTVDEDSRRMTHFVI